MPCALVRSDSIADSADALSPALARTLDQTTHMYPKLRRSATSPQSIHEWHLLAAGTARLFDPVVAIPEWLAAVSPEYP